MNNYYKILQVDSEASQEVIEKAYKALVKKYHPDLKSGTEKVEAENMIKIINEAYEVLSNNVKREEYDKQLNAEKLRQEQLEQERKLKLERERLNNEILKNSYNNSNIRNTNNSVNNAQNLNNTQNTYNPMKEPVKYYSQSIKNYINKTKQEKYDEEQLYNQELYNQELYNQKMNDAYNKAYHDAYVQNLKRAGFKIRYKKTFKDYLRISITIIAIIFVCFILWQIPFIRNFLLNIYNTNPVIKIVVDIIINIVSSFFATITNTSLL